MSEERKHAWRCVAGPRKLRKNGCKLFCDWRCDACERLVTLPEAEQPEAIGCQPAVPEEHRHTWHDVGYQVQTVNGRQMEVWDISCILCFESRRLVLERGQMQRLRQKVMERARAKRAASDRSPLVAEAVVIAAPEPTWPVPDLEAA